MKRLLLCVGLVGSVCYADRQQEDFLQAQQLAQGGKYEEALVLYNTFLNPGFLVWYNKGVCLYHIGKYCDALLAFKKAQRYADKNTYKMVAAALKDVAYKGNYETSFSWQDSIRVSTYYIPIFIAQLIFLLLLGVTVWMILFRPFSWKRIILLSLMIINGIYLGVVWYVTNRVQGVITVGTSSYTGPGKEYQAYKEFSVGTVVNVDKKEKNWYKVKTLNSSGWVEETSLSLIEE